MSAREEHLATRRSAGLFDFSFMGLYEFPARESIEGLQTRNLDELRTGQLAYTLILNEDGSVFNDATVWRHENDRFWLFTGRPGDYTRFRGSARDRSGEHAILALQGPKSGLILSRLIGEQAVRDLRYFRFMEADGLVIGRLGYSGELGYELLVPDAMKPVLCERLMEAGETENLRQCRFEAANSLRIESGYVIFDREVDGYANPAELGLERLAPGRTFSIKRKLVGLELTRGALPAGCEANLTSECFSPMLQRHIGLGFVDPAAGAPGTDVRLRDGRAAKVRALPFHDPRRERPRAAPL